jgi:hypothetical protein
MRRTRHRRRFHTDRVVRNRRRRYWRESSATAWNAGHFPEWFAKRMAYGVLADRDPWDCGRRCLLCHWDKHVEPRRARENRAWRADWGI